VSLRCEGGAAFGQSTGASYHLKVGLHVQQGSESIAKGSMMLY
jgi:hypothetical protein